MKKIIRKFWGVAIIVILLSSLFIAAAPAAADTALTWNLDIFMPSYVPATVWVQYPNTDIMDFAVSPDGMTLYVALRNTTPSATDNTILLKGTMGGAVWTDLTSAANNRIPIALDSIDFVAMSPDNPDVVVVLDAGGFDGAIKAAASTDGGNNFYDMGTIADSTGDAVAVVYDLDVSPAATNNIYYVAVAGTSTAGNTNDATLYYYNFGAAVGVWRDAVTDFGTAAVTPNGLPTPWTSNPDDFRAVKFSPNFSGDSSVVAVSENIGASLDLHILSLSAHRWDTDLALTGYPIQFETSALAANCVGIGAGPDWVGSEQETQITFVGASVTVAGAESGGLYRIDDTGTVKEIRSNTGVYSVDYDGTTVVAGASLDDNVFRVADPLSGSPTASSARSLKRIGVDGPGNDDVVVHFAGETVFGAKRSSASALSKSTDMGNTWNDFALMDSSNTDIDDLMIAPDASVKFQSSNDWNGTDGEVSVYRVAGPAVQRVLCVAMTAANTPNLLLRGISSDMDVIYAYDEGGTDIYQSSDGGVSRWSRKTTYPGAVIADLAVESSSIVYAATGQLVYKSTNSGSGWGDGVDTGVNVFSLLSLGEGKIVAGGANTYVGWSTDSGATWAHNGAPVPGANFIVAATGLAATDYIFAAPTGAGSAGAGAQVYRANPTPFVEFKSMNLPGWVDADGDAVTAQTQALTLTNGILYVSGSVAPTNGLYLWHSQAPTIPGTHLNTLWGVERIFTGGYMIAPALRAAATTSEIDLYAALNSLTIGGTNGVFKFEDIVSLPSAAPTLTGPADGALFKIVSTMLADSQLVNFTWNLGSSTITQYWLWISLDEGFTQVVSITPVTVVSPVPIVSAIGARNTFQPGLTYYWRVNARLPFDGGFSETRSFTIEPSGASVPSILSPITGGSIDTVSPVFSWSGSSGATKYDFQISELPGFETTVFTDQTTSPAEALPVTISLERGKTYFWRVRSAEPVQGDWSSIGTFTIAALTTTTSAPPPVTITQTSITIPIPPSTTTIITQPPVIEKTIAPAYIWAIIIIGAILVIAVIVLIVRTRRSV
jgi:hypothetical protein